MENKLSLVDSKGKFHSKYNIKYDVSIESLEKIIELLNSKLTNEKILDVIFSDKNKTIFFNGIDFQTKMDEFSNRELFIYHNLNFVDGKAILKNETKIIAKVYDRAKYYEINKIKSQYSEPFSLELTKIGVQRGCASIDECIFFILKYCYSYLNEINENIIMKNTVKTNLKQNMEEDIRNSEIRNTRDNRDSDQNKYDNLSLSGRYVK